jgi:hypothetical protein
LGQKHRFCEVKELNDSSGGVPLRAEPTVTQSVAERKIEQIFPNLSNNCAIDLFDFE